MRYKESSRHIQVKSSSDPLNKHLQPLFSTWHLRALLNSTIEQPLNIGKTVLIHRINARQIGNDKVQDAATC